MRDDDLRRLLDSVDHPVEPEHAFSEALFERLTAEAAGRRPVSRPRFLALLAATLLLAATIGLGAAVAGGLVHLPWVAVLPGPTSSQAEAITSASASPSVTPSATPSGSSPPHAGVDVPDGVLPAYSTIRVQSGQVVIHAAPDATSAVVASVPAGTELTIGFPSPLVINGTLWYAVTAVDDPTKDGWAALDPTDGSVWVPPWNCPLSPPASDGLTPLADLTGVRSHWAGLACHGDTEFTVEGVEITSGIGGLAPGTWQPDWLAYPFPGLVLVPQGQAGTTVGIHLPPSIVLPSPDPSLPAGMAPLLRVTGHFDDAASSGCSVTDVPLGDGVTGGPTAPVDPAHAVVYCREQFVADSVTVIGTARDPLMP